MSTCSPILISAGLTYGLELSTSGNIIGWGDNSQGAALGGSSLTGVTGISAGYNGNGLAVLANGTVTGWGSNAFGQTLGGSGVTGAKSVQAGPFSSFAILNNNHITGWGDNTDGQITSGLNLTGVASIAAGYYSWIALLYNGKVTGWGDNSLGQTLGGTGLTGVTGIAASFNNGFSLALLANGRITGWGNNINNCVSGGLGLTGVKSISIGSDHCLALLANGTVTGWGNNGGGQSLGGNSLTGVTMISANNAWSLGLLANGEITGWGSDAYGQISAANLINGQCQQGYLTQIVINGLNNLYNGNPNPINAFTYPQTGATLSITYNGSTTPPTNTGSYIVNVSVSDSRYYATPFTGIYSIIGSLIGQSYAIGWGKELESDYSISYDYSTAPSGLIGVQKVAGAKDFSVALMNNNSIVTWGKDNGGGQQNIPHLSTYIKDIAVTNGTTFLLDWNNNLTGCGYLFNTLGNGYNGIMPILTGIASVSPSNSYAIAIPQDPTKSLIGWGNPVFFDYSVGLYLTGVSQLCCTYYGCMALINNQVTGWGTNQWGQLLTQTSGPSIKKIACSDMATVLLYQNGTITGYGNQLDLNGNAVPFSIPNPSIQGQVLDISVSDTQTLLILNSHISNPSPPSPPSCTGIVFG